MTIRKSFHIRTETNQLVHRNTHCYIYVRKHNPHPLYIECIFLNLHRILKNNYRRYSMHCWHRSPVPCRCSDTLRPSRFHFRCIFSGLNRSFGGRFDNQTIFRRNSSAKPDHCSGNHHPYIQQASSFRYWCKSRRQRWYSLHKQVYRKILRQRSTHRSSPSNPLHHTTPPLRQCCFHKQRMSPEEHIQKYQSPCSRSDNVAYRHNCLRVRSCTSAYSMRIRRRVPLVQSPHCRNNNSNIHIHSRYRRHDL